MTTPLHLPDDFHLAVSRYTDASIRVNEAGEMSAREHEELRSYAVEAIHALLAANPDTFEYAGRMRPILERKRA